jgi:hypothetical protein
VARLGRPFQAAHAARPRPLAGGVGANDAPLFRLPLRAFPDVLTVAWLDERRSAVRCLAAFGTGRACSLEATAYTKSFVGRVRPRANNPTNGQTNATMTFGPRVRHGLTWLRCTESCCCETQRTPAAQPRQLPAGRSTSVPPVSVARARGSLRFGAVIGWIAVKAHRKRTSTKISNLRSSLVFSCYVSVLFIFFLRLDLASFCFYYMGN